MLLVTRCYSERNISSSIYEITKMSLKYNNIIISFHSDVGLSNSSYQVFTFSVDFAPKKGGKVFIKMQNDSYEHRMKTY